MRLFYELVGGPPVPADLRFFRGITHFRQISVRKRNDDHAIHIDQPAEKQHLSETCDHQLLTANALVVIAFAADMQR